MNAPMPNCACGAPAVRQWKEGSQCAEHDTFNKRYYCRVYHQRTGHSCGTLTIEGRDITGTRDEIQQHGNEFVANFPEYSFEIQEVQ